MYGSCYNLLSLRLGYAALNVLYGQGWERGLASITNDKNLLTDAMIRRLSISSN